MKMKINIKHLLILLILAIFSVPVYGANALQQKASVSVNGSTTEVDAYMVDGTYYFNIRVVAALFSNTPLSFSVDWDESKNAVTLTSSRQGEQSQAIVKINETSGNATAKPSSALLLANGHQIDVKGMEIGGSNYYDLESLTDALGIKYDYIDATKTFVLNTASNSNGSQTAWPKLLNAKDIYEKCSPAVFYIETYDMYGDVLANGSGFFIEENGNAVTNLHVLEGAFSASVTLTDGRELPVSNLVAINQSSDIAVVAVDGTGFSYLKLGDNQKTKGGEKIYTIGSPLGLSNTISEGIVSNPSRKVNDKEYIQISAPISHGSSGGALINEKAEIIGITSAGVENGQNLNFAIPVSAIQTTLAKKLPTPVSFEKLAEAMTIAEFATIPEPFAYIVDEEEPNDIPETAQYIENGSSVLGVIDLKTPDYFYTACNMPGTLAIYCFSLGDDIKNAELVLFDSAGKQEIEGTIFDLDDGDTAIGAEIVLDQPDYVTISLARKEGAGVSKKDIEYVFYYEFVPITESTD